MAVCFHATMQTFSPLINIVVDNGLLYAGPRLHNGIDTQLIHVPGYNVYRRDRGDGGSGGGVLVYVRYGQPCVPISNLQNPQFQVLWLSFRANCMPRFETHLLVGLVYHPPGANNTNMNEYLVSSIDSFSRSHPSCGVIALGDLNRIPEGPLCR